MRICNNNLGQTTLPNIWAPLTLTPEAFAKQIQAGLQPYSTPAIATSPGGYAYTAVVSEGVTDYLPYVLIGAFILLMLMARD